MNTSIPISSEITHVSFSFYTSDEIRKLSVKQITNPVLLDTLDHPTISGLYDPALGPTDKHSICATCSLDIHSCPGHFGHIELSGPVYNPITFKLLYKLLGSLCFYCHSLRLSDPMIHYYTAKLKLLHAGLITEASELDSIKKSFTSAPKETYEQTDESLQKMDASFTFVEKLKHRIDTFVKKCLAHSHDKGLNKSILKTDALKKLEKEILSSIPTLSCAHCEGQSPKFRHEANTKIFQKPLSAKQRSLMNSRGKKFQKLVFFDKSDKQGGESVGDNTVESSSSFPVNDQYLTPLQVVAHIKMLWDSHKEFFDLLYGTFDSKMNCRISSPNFFFMNVVSIPPNKFRPMSKMGDMTYEHAQNTNLTAVLKANILIQTLREQEKRTLATLDPIADPKLYQNTKSEYLGKLIEAWIQLQTSVNLLIDNSKAPNSSTNAPPGIRQVLEKKEGLFRKHMMGKRVNYAARSVISPDPYIETSEIGIPPVFASKLTYPEPVTHQNVEILRQYVVNGPTNWPGATHVQNEDGSMINLAHLDESGRTAIANQLLTPQVSNQNTKNVNKKVLRHLRNGDFLLLNRQPTLHKPSIMAHTARILPGEKTIRMHYANCNTYNADFDGDEMNIHFPQNEVARAEAMLIARTDLQYLVPTDGGVLRGLIQDHVDAGVDMSSKDTFLDRETYMQLVFAALRPDDPIGKGIGNGKIENEVVIGRNGHILTVPPVFFKPKMLWTGKQVITTILLNLIPQNRDLLNLKSKCKIPAKSWGPHSEEEQYVMFMDGYFLTGILDKSQFGASAHGLVHAVYEVYGPPYAGKLLSILGRLFTAHLQFTGFSCRMDDLLLTPSGDLKRTELISTSADLGLQVAGEVSDLKEIDLHAEEAQSLIRDKLEECLREDEKMAHLDSCMKSKTNRITSQIISTCIPDYLVKPFPQNNMQVMTVSGAKGSSVNVSQISCLLGQQELEGRRVPTMISGKTLPSFLAFDTSARSGGFITGRFLTGIKPQEYYFHCMAGREGLIDTAVKTSRSGYLQRCLIKHLEGLRVHYDQTVRDVDGSVLQFHYGEDSLDVIKSKSLNKFDFCAMNYKALLQRYSPSKLAGKVDEDAVLDYIRKNKKIQDSDPVLSLYNPGRYVGSVSDKFYKDLEKYIQENPSKLIKSKSDHHNKSEKHGWSGRAISSKKFKGLMDIKYMHSLVEPGEAVGLLAAQSIGEPSTQMTLNTFHFAGFGAKNVTLGIPRLREIIMTASANIKTPMMRLPLQSHVTAAQGEELAKTLSRLVLSRIMTNVTVDEQIGPKKSSRSKLMTITLDFWPKEAYFKDHGILPTDLAKTIESKFLPALERAIKKDMKSKTKNVDEEIGKGVSESSSSKAIKSKQKDADDSDDEDARSDIGGDEADATAAKTSQNRTQHASYDEPDEDDEEVIAEADAAMEMDSDDEESKDTEDQEKSLIQQASHDKAIRSCDYITGMEFDITKGNQCRLRLEFPIDSKKILMVPMVEQVCNQVTIRELKGILRCYPLLNESENDKSLNLGADGVSFQGIWLYNDKIDLTKIYTNDIAAILNNYGVEAARAAIMQEIAGVFGVYGINVDPRHLSLIADYMTFEGGYKPFNRIGMNSNPSPFAQMSFETTTSFLVSATLSGDFDPLESPSARLVLGKVVRVGTGAFEIRQPLMA